MRRRNGVNLRAIVAKDIPNVAVLHACCFEDPRHAEDNSPARGLYELYDRLGLRTIGVRFAY